MPVFEFKSEIAAPVRDVFAFHERPDALERLLPPWQDVQLLERTGGLEPGARAVLLLRLGPLRLRWVALHTEYERDRLFVDTQLSGPFRAWTHRHEFHAQGPATLLIDRVEFSLHGGPPADLLGGWLAKQQLRKMFRYRHQVTRAFCERPLTEEERPLHQPGSRTS